MSRFFLCLLLSLGLVAAHPLSVRADTFQRVGALMCDARNNKFIVRFGLLFNDDSLDKAELADMPDNLLPGWRAATLQTNSSCQLADGRKISLSVRHGQSFPYGQGGGNPDAGFTLKIDGKDIYYNETFFAGYALGEYTINAVIYQNRQLTECSGYSSTIETCRAEEKPYSQCLLNRAPQEITCSDATNRLDGNALSSQERTERERTKKRHSLAKNISPFCKELRAQPHITYKDYEYIGKTPGGHLSVIDIDINNDGKIDRVFRNGASSQDCMGCGYNYFDGSFLIAFTAGHEKAADFIAAAKENDLGLDSNHAGVRHIADWGAYFISLGAADASVRYVYNIPLVFKGEAYIYSFAINKNHIPSANISKITKDNQATTICAFP